MAKQTRRDADKEAFWRQAIQEQAKSGRTIRSFCRRRRLGEGIFYWWRRELSRRQGKQQGQAAFVPVQVAAEPGMCRKRSSAYSGKPELLSPGGSRIEIVLAGGQRLELAGPVDGEALATVLSVLEGRSC